MYTTRLKKASKKNRRPYFIAAAAIVITAIAITAALAVNHNSTNSSKQISLSSTSKENSGKQSNAHLPATTTTNSANGNASSAQGSGTSAKAPDTPQTPNGAPPKAPSGQFVSSHSATTSGSNFGVATEQSVCNTTPGATCEITFTQNGTTKSLGKKTTDKSGAAYWSGNDGSGWRVADYLTNGAWKVTATATSNGQTTSTTDTNNLVVN